MTCHVIHIIIHVNHFGAKTRIFQVKLVNTMAAVAPPATCIARSPVTMVQTMQDQRVIVNQVEGFQPPVPSQCWVTRDNVNKVSFLETQHMCTTKGDLQQKGRTFRKKIEICNSPPSDYDSKTSLSFRPMVTVKLIHVYIRITLFHFDCSWKCDAYLTELCICCDIVILAVA